MPDAGKAEPDNKQQKRSAGHSFLVPCDERSAKKQCLPNVLKVRLNAYHLKVVLRELYVLTSLMHCRM
jgi:hypothetical protein